MINNLFGSAETALNNRHSIAMILNFIKSAQGQVDKKIIAEQFSHMMQDKKVSDKNIFGGDNIFIFDLVDSCDNEIE